MKILKLKDKITIRKEKNKTIADHQYQFKHDVGENR